MAGRSGCYAWGLDGINIEADAATEYADPQVANGYAEFERKWGYRIV